MSRTRVIGAGVLTVCALLLTTAGPATAHPREASPAPVHEPPVDAEVLDPFRAPDSPFGAGNRGLLYDTPAGVPVTATAAGVVVFAGQVGGALHVTVRHADEVRTSYSFLADIHVVRGQRLERGQVLGSTGGPFHLGARLADAYFDPAHLFGDAAFDVELVPFDLPLPGGVGGERSALGQLLGGLVEGAANRVLGATGATVEWLRANGGQVARTAAHYLEPAPIRLARGAWSAYERAQRIARRPCTTPGTAAPVPAGRRVAVSVAGLGSTSRSASVDRVDFADLGYAAADVVRFSYAGGRTPDTGAGFTDLPANHYGTAETQQDLRAAALLLADALEHVAAAAAGAPVDIYAHSQGGLVARLALTELVRRHGSAWVAQLGVVFLLATPNGGADLATGVYALGSGQKGSRLLDVAGAVVGLDDDAPTVAQMSEVSDLVRGLADERPPPGVDVVSIAARTDLLVPTPRTPAPGARHVVISVGGLSAHSELPGSEAAEVEMRLALAGMPPSCETFSDALADGLVGEAISYAEDNLMALGWFRLLYSGGKPLGG